MDLELGLKITKTRDDIASISEYRLAKAGPIFQSKETNTMFILTAHLKGYKRNDINIKISEDGNKISIIGEKPVQNILMMGWLMHRKEVDVAGFHKVFKIPDGVKLDGIKAKYDEEEWMLNIFMPKLVKGICGAKIEEIKEESERGRSKLEKNEANQIFSSAGEPSQKGSKESEVQAMENSESFMEKKEGGISDTMLDDANREMIKEKIQKGVQESKFGTKDANGEGSGEKSGMEGYEEMKTSELEKNVGRATSQKIGDTNQRETEETKLWIADGGVKGKGKEVGKTAHEAVKTSEMEKNVGEAMPQNIGDSTQDEECGVQEMEDSGGLEEEEKLVSEKLLDDANGNIIGEVIQKEREESKSGIEDRCGENVKEKIGKAGYKSIETSEIEQNVGAHITQNMGDTSQGVSKESVIEQMGKDKRIVGKMERKEFGEKHVEVNVSTEGETLRESKQNQFGEPKPETEDRLKESGMELMETMKAQKPSNIGSTSQQEFKKSRIQQKEKTESIDENMDGGESERMPDESSKDTQKHKFGESIQKDIKKPNIETEDGEQEYDGEKAGKEEFDSMMSTREEFPKQLPKATVEGSKGLGISEMLETEHVKEAKIKRKAKEIEYFVDKGEGKEPRRMHMEVEKDLTREKMQESEEVKEIEYFVDKGEGEEPKGMHMESNKDSTKESTQETKYVKEAKVKREDKEVDYFLDEIEDEGKEPKRMHMKVKKDIKIETIQETEDVKEVKFKRKDKEVENFADKTEREEHRSMHVEPKKDSKKETMQEIGDAKEAMVKRRGEEIENFVDKDEGEELGRKQRAEKKDLTKETMKKSEDVKEVMVNREGNGIENANKGEGKEPRKIFMETKKDWTKDRMQESKDVKEAMVKRKGREIEYFEDKGSEEPTRMHMKGKNDLIETMHKNEDVKEVIVKRIDKENKNFMERSEGKEPKKMHMEANKDLKRLGTLESEDDKQAMGQRKGKENKYFMDKGEEEPKMVHTEGKKGLTTEITQESEVGKEEMITREGKKVIDDEDEDAEPNKINVQAKKDLTKKTRQQSEEDKETMIKRKGRETENFKDKGEDKEPERVHIEAKKDLNAEAIQESKDIREAMVNKEGKNIEYYVDEGEGEEPKRIHMKTKKDLTTETKQESEDFKEAKVKREGKDVEYFMHVGEDKEPNGMLREANKDLTIETMQESEDVKEATVKRKDKDIECFVDHGGGKKPRRIHEEVKKDLRKETMQENEYVKEAMVKRKGKEIDYFVDKEESEELKRTNVEAKKDLRKETMQENEYVKQAMVKRKGKEIDYFVDKEESEELKRTDVEAKKDITKETMQEKIEKIKNGIEEINKEEMAETGSLMERVKGEKSNNNKTEVGRVMQKSTVTEILQTETEEPNVERKSKDGLYVPDNMIKLIFEVLGTLEAKLPKQVMEAISQNEDKNEYVTVKLKGEGSIKMRMESNEDESEDRNEKEIRRPKPKSSDQRQRSREENIDTGASDGSKRPKFLEMGETKDVKEDSARIEEPEKKLSGDKYEKIQVKEERGLRKDITRESTQEERECPKIQTMEKNRHHLLEERSIGRPEASKAAKEEFPIKMVDSIAYKREEIKGTKIDEAKMAKEELVKQTSEQTKIAVKEKGAEIEQFVKKVKGEKYEKIQVEAKEGLRKDMTKEKDQQCLQEGTSKGIYEARKKTEEFPMQIVDSPTKTREGTKDKEIKELAKRKSPETDVESTVEEKVQEPKSGRISMTFKQVPEDKHPKVLEIGAPERELQSTKGTTTHGKVVSVGFKGVEQESAKDTTQKTKLPKKTKIFEGEHCTYNIGSTKEVSRFPSTPQTKVEEKDKLNEGSKAEASIESQKGDPTTDMKDLIEMEDNQESKQRKTLKPDIPLEKHYNKGEPVTRKDEFAKGQKRIRETMQEETKGPKGKVVDRDQQYVQRDVSKGVGKVDTIAKETPGKKYVADVGLVAQMMETERDLKVTPEGEKYAIAQIVKDEKPRIQEENIKADVEKVEKKGYEPKAVEGMLRGERLEEVVPENKRERPKVANIEETKEASKLPLRKMGKTNQTAEEKPTIRKITPEFEKASGLKQAAGKMHESEEIDYQRDLEEVTPKMTPNKGVEKSKKEEMSPMPIAIQRKEPHELSLPSKHYKIPKKEEVQQKKEGKRPIHALEATTSKDEEEEEEEEELAQATATHSKTKSEIDEPQAIQLPSPSIQMSSKEQHELHKHGMKEDDSKTESLVKMQEGKTASEVVTDKVAKPSKFSSSSSTQPFEVEGKDKNDTSRDEESKDSEKNSKKVGQETTKDETDQDVEQRETLKPEFPEDQQCINEEQEENHGTHEIEEEKTYEQGDKASQEDSQLLEEQKECEVETTGGKKNDQKRSKKLFVSLIIGGSALIASGIFLFIRHRRARRGAK